MKKQKKYWRTGITMSFMYKMLISNIAEKSKRIVRPIAIPTTLLASRPNKLNAMYLANNS